MRIIVTGGAGFIASHIVDAYLKEGHSVAVVDNLSEGSRKNLNSRARFYKVDIRRQEILEAIFKKEKPNAVSHHAAIASVVDSFRDPKTTIDVNVIGTANVLIAAGKVKAEKIIFSSTGDALYGSPNRLPVPEFAPLNPLSPYGLSKLLGEEMTKFFGAAFGFSHTIFRYANIYGPRQNPHGKAGIVAIFSELIRQNKRPTIFGDGSKTRDYVFVSDIIAPNVLALERRENEVFNLGLGKEISDIKVFGAIARSLNFIGEPKFAPFRKGEVFRVALDAGKVRRILKWQPKISFSEGVKKTLSANK